MSGASNEMTRQPESEESALVEVRGLSRWYGDHQALDDLSFSLAPGDILGFLGPNGAGKSTTMRILTGNLAPSAGSISIAGADLVDRPREAKRHLGYLPEHPPLYRDFTVDEYLRFAARLHGVARGALASAVERARERCGLGDKGRRLIANLSKGYQQRVGIAQAIVHDPAVVILDEPTVGLDPNQIRAVRDLIRDLGRDHGVILSTHILPEVQSVCTRVQIINKGRLVFADSLAGLEQRARVPALSLRFRQPPPRDALEAIDGVERVESTAEGGFLLYHGQGAEIQDAVARASLEQGWGLLSLSPQSDGLERVFLDLTLGDVTPGDLTPGDVTAADKPGPSAFGAAEAGGVSR